MLKVCLTFEQSKLILKWWRKFENACKMQRRPRPEFVANFPQWLTISRIRHRFETDGNVQYLYRRLSGWHASSISGKNSDVTLHQLKQSPCQSVKRCAGDTAITRTSATATLRAEAAHTQRLQSWISWMISKEDGQGCKIYGHDWSDEGNIHSQWYSELT
jgi:hypothetical protein